jgi:choline dehydrogenase-like flavoprotein
MFDYLIVGGGAAGSVLAARLSEDPAVSVCLLEAGPPDRSALVHCPAGFALLARLGNINWGFETVPQPGLLGRRGYQPRGKVLGGSASVNAMIYIRGQREDYEHWAAEGNPGWGWDDVLPYFRRAEHNERGADALHATGGPLNVADLQQPNRFSALFVEAALQDGLPRNDDFNGPTQEGAGLYQVMQKGGERCSPAKGYLTPHLGRRPNLQVLTDARVRRVRFDGRRATGVEVVQGAATRTLEARREVLLCAGALQSPQILQLSGVGDGAMLQALGVPVVHHLPGVGEHLHDHVDVTVVHRADGRTELFGLSLPGALNALQGVLQWRRERRGIAKLLDHGRTTVLGHGYSCHVCVLRPESRGRVTLASANPDAAPAIDPGFLAAPGDLERLVAGFRRVRSILGRPALAGLGGRELAGSAAARTDEEIERFVRSHADTIYHPVGSCRMGPGPRDVVDAQLRVHGLEGLRVVDASIMPRIVSGNTTAPTVMIAERAADLVRAAARAA